MPTMPATSNNKSSSPYYIPASGCTDFCLHWFPLRVAYGRSLRVYDYLRTAGIECFLPMNEVAIPQKKDAIDSEKPFVKLVPLINNLIFVHSTRERIIELKHLDNACSSLRFITYVPRSSQYNGMSPESRSASNRIIVVPDQEMNDFQRTIADNIHNITLIPYNEVANHVGKKVRILRGPLTGIIGTLRRVHGNRHVCIDCGGILSAQIGFLPREMYELVEKE